MSYDVDLRCTHCGSCVESFNYTYNLSYAFRAVQNGLVQHYALSMLIGIFLLIFAFLRELQPDLILTVAYGKIFRRRLLELPRLGCYNLHPSLLPRYRGLSPVQRRVDRGRAQVEAAGGDAAGRAQAPRAAVDEEPDRAVRELDAMLAHAQGHGGGRAAGGSGQPAPGDPGRLSSAGTPRGRPRRRGGCG